MPRDSHLAWAAPYVPEELRAKGAKGGKEAAESRVVTTGPAMKVVLLPDRAAIRADGRDVAIIRVAIQDAAGRTVPVADNEAAFDVTVSGRLIGVGNGNPCSHEPDKEPRRRAFNGHCLAIVRSTRDAGEVKISATSAGLETAPVILEPST
jgi:beta-galactosidase